MLNCLYASQSPCTLFYYQKFGNTGFSLFLVASHFLLPPFVISPGVPCSNSLNSLLPSVTDFPDEAICGLVVGQTLLQGCLCSQHTHPPNFLKYKDRERKSKNIKRRNQRGEKCMKS